MNFSIEVYGLDSSLMVEPFVTEQWEALDRFFPYPWTTDGWRDLYNQWDHHLVLHAVESQKIIGMILYGFNSDQTAHLYKIVVNPDLRKKGLGDELLGRSIDFLKTKSCKGIFLEVEDTNTAAHNLYLKHDFENLHLARNFYGQNRHAYKMMLSIP